VHAEEGAAYGAAILAGTGARHWQSVDEACNSRCGLPHLPANLSGTPRDLESCWRGVCGSTSHRVRAKLTIA
jgi:glycerol kinase